MGNFEKYRLAIFIAVLAVMAVWEILCKRRKLTDSKLRRWADNLLLTGTNTLLMRFFAPVIPVVFAGYCRDNSIGLFNNYNLHTSAGIIISLILLDLIIYFQHFVFHAFPVFWKLHMVHHADLDIDVTTALRFHPFEIAISLIIKIASVYVFGFSPFSVFLFEIILNAAAMFNHSNVYMPPRIDSLIRLIIVTPDMHRVHHSVIIRETNSNFGFCISLWDRIFSTYIPQPLRGHDSMTIGLSHIRKPFKYNFLIMLIMPIIKNGGNYSFNKIGSYESEKTKGNIS